MPEEKLYKYLEEFGLNQYEAKAYVALVAKGTATASEISDASGIPYTRVYDALNSLESKGLIFKTPGRPMRFKAVHPSIALRNLRRKIRYDFEKKLKELERREKGVVEELCKLYEQVAERVSENIQMLRGRIGIHGAISSLLRQAGKEEVLLVTTPTTIQRIIIANSEDLQRAVATGAKIKAIVWGDIKEAPQWLEVTNLPQVSGAKLLNIMVVGNNTLFFESIFDNLSLDSDYDAGLLIVNERLAETIRLIAQYISYRV